MPHPSPDYFTLQPLATTKLLSVSVPIRDHAYTGTHTARGLCDWLLSLSVMCVHLIFKCRPIYLFVYLFKNFFTPRNVFEVYPCGTTNQLLPSFLVPRSVSWYGYPTFYFHWVGLFQV